MEFVYTVDKWSERDGLWYPAHRKGKGSAFNTISGAKAYISRENRRWGIHPPPLGKYRINVYETKLVNSQEVS